MYTAHQSSSFIERRRADDLSPAYEDFGLFKAPIMTVEVSLTPVMSRNSRDDLVIRGFNDRSQTFEVLFAGRRLAMAGPVIARLEALRTLFQRQVKARTPRTDQLEDMRLPVLVEGAWRRRYWVDDIGWQRHVNQLVAARWSLLGEGDTLLTYGICPSQSAIETLPVVGDRRAGEGGHVQQTARRN